MAVDRKTKTAVKDLRDSLGIPHNPCPLVHPLDNSVPAPTRAPAAINLLVELAKLN